MCTCLARTQQALAKLNQRLPLLLSLSGGPDRPYFQTELLRPRRGQKPLQLIPTFCPFCGVEYPTTATPKVRPDG